MYNPSYSQANGCQLAARAAQNRHCRRHQRGASLVELLVGLAIGLMVIAAAIGTLVISRATSRGVNDQVELQQQANTALRIMALQVRQTNGREVIVLGPGTTNFSNEPIFPIAGATASIVAFPRSAFGDDDVGLSYADIGPLNPPWVTARSQDCLGDSNTPATTPAGTPVASRFFVVNNQLMCRGTANALAQPLVADVQRFRVLYLVQTALVAPFQYQYFTQATLPVGSSIVGLEVCLELASPVRPTGDVPAGTYNDCDGNPLNFDNRARVVVRQAIRLRAVKVET
jgi:type IV pilus assembly protein PilW